MIVYLTVRGITNMKMLFISGSAFLILTTLTLMIVIPKYNTKIDGLAKAVLNLSDTIKEKEFQFSGNQSLLMN